MVLRTRRRVRLPVLTLSICIHPVLAHVLFTSPATAQDAVKKLHAHVFKGALLSVTLKKRFEARGKIPQASTPMPNRANRLIIRNLAFDITEQDLRAIFLPHGSIYSIDIPRTDASNNVKVEAGEPSVPPRGKGFAFVWMWNRKEAETALNTCNGMQVRAGFASNLIKDKQKKKKVRREEKKQAESREVHDDSGRTIAVDWALSKDKWEQEKKDLNDVTESDSQDEQASNTDTESLQNTVDEPDENDDGEESVIDVDHKETEEDVSDEEKAGTRPSLPQPEAGTTLFIRNIPFLATEDELRTL
jgi:nucleolar protein 4